MSLKLERLSSASHRIKFGDLMMMKKYEIVKFSLGKNNNLFMEIFKDGRLCSLFLPKHLLDTAIRANSDLREDLGWCVEWHGINETNNNDIVAMYRDFEGRLPWHGEYLRAIHDFYVND